MIVTGEQLHIWYLEAVANLRLESFNPNAQKPYSELTEEQRSIDEFIAGKIRQRGEGLEKENAELRADKEQVVRRCYALAQAHGYTGWVGTQNHAAAKIKAEFPDCFGSDDAARKEPA